MTTTPLARPFRSGNHRTAVGIGGLYAKPMPSPTMTPYVSVRYSIGHGTRSRNDERMYPEPTRRPAKTMPTENSASWTANGSMTVKLVAPNWL